MQIHITVWLASFVEVHWRASLIVLSRSDRLQLEGKVLRLTHLFKYADDEVLVIEESYVMQASILVEVPWADKVIETFLQGQYLLKESYVTFLDDALDVGHLRIA